MMGNVSTTISVFFSTDTTGAKIIQCFPNSDIVIPAQSVATVTWKAIASPSGVHPQPQFVLNSLQATGPDASKVVFSGQTSTQFITTVTNPGASVTAGVAFKASYGTGQPPPPVIDGSGAIRNKGTSIFTVPILAALISSLALGFVIGYVARALIFGEM